MDKILKELKSAKAKTALEETLKNGVVEFVYINKEGTDWRFTAQRANLKFGEGEYSTHKNPNYVEPVKVKEG